MLSFSMPISTGSADNLPRLDWHRTSFTRPEIAIGVPS
jgi:hypothetical protein